MSGLKLSKQIARLLQWVSSFILLLLSLILIVFLVKDIFALIKLLFFATNEHSTSLLLEGLITYFLYFEFIALIIKYFQTTYHFPLKYFIYIGITAIVRLIIINHDDSTVVLINSLAVLALTLSLYVVSSKKISTQI